MVVTIYLMTALIISLLVLLIIAWLVHVSQVKDCTGEYGYGNYKKFKEQFTKRNWIKTSFGIWGGSNNRFESAVLIFNGIGMAINNPFSYLLVLIHVANYKRNLNKKKLYKW